MPAPAPAPAAIPPQAEAQPRAPWEDWTEVRIESQGRAATVERARAFRLASLLYGVVNSRGDAAPGDEPAAVRITLSRMGLTVGVLELGPRQARWVAQGAATRTLQPDADALRLLTQEAQRLAGS